MRSQHFVTKLHCFVQVRGKKENLLLAGLIGGPNKPQSLQPFMLHLVNQLHQGWEGFLLKDPETGEDFKCRLLLAFSQHDYPAMRDMALRHDAGVHSLYISL